MAPKYLESEAL